MEDRYVSIKTVIEQFGISRTSIYKWMSEGRFPKARKFGRTSRWALSEVETWANESPLKGA